MDKEQVKIIISLYNQVFDDYTRQMMWLCNKKDFSQNKKFVISHDIKEKALIELLRVHEWLKQENGLPNALEQFLFKNFTNHVKDDKHIKTSFNTCYVQFSKILREGGCLDKFI